MAAETITTYGIRALSESKVIRDVIMVGVPGGFHLKVLIGMAEKTLVSHRQGKERLFVDANRAFSFIQKSMHLAHVRVDLANWSPALPKTKEKRNAKRNSVD